MMKIMLLSILISLTTYLSIYSQNDTLIDFENINSMIEIDSSDKNNIWQIGQPSKQDFKSAYSGIKAIITDSFNSYPINCNSKFILKIDSKYLNHEGVDISFWHKFETAAENDYGIIEFSFDGGGNWQLLQDSSYNDAGGMGWWRHTDTVGTSWSLNLYVTGSSPGWILSEYWWAFYIPSKIALNDVNSEMTFKSTSELIPDSIFLRFQFISDSIANNKSGWIIDNIIIKEVLIADVSENSIDNKILTFPNPTSEIITILLPENSSFSSFALYNMDGKKLLENKNLERTFKLNVSEYKKGIYFITFFGESSIITKPIIIN